MIYLIGGSPRAGKSTLAKKMLKRMHVPCISTDNIKPIIMPYFDAGAREEKFPYMKMFDAGTIDDFFRKYSAKEMLEADLKESESIWPGVKTLIDHLLLCGVDYIIEGVHLLPDLIEHYKGNENVRVVYLIKSDEEKILDGLYKNTDQQNDWVMDNTKNEETIRLAAKSLVACGEYFTAESEKYGFNCINTEDGFEDSLSEAGKYLKK